MDTFKEFEAQSLDDAIRAACEFYDAPREKLEIEIINDAKNGIFGLVGAKKACVKARRVTRGMAQFADANDAPSEADALSSDAKGNRLSAEAKASKAPKARAERDGGKDKPATASTKPKRATPADAKDGNGNGKPKERTPQARDDRKKHERQAAPAFVQDDADSGFDEDMQPPNVDNGYDGPTMFEDMASSVAMQGRRTHTPKQKAPRVQLAPKPSFDADFEGSSAPASHGDEQSIGSINDAEFEKLDKDVLLETTKIIANKLVLPISESAILDVQIVKTRVGVHIDCGDDSGIIIGREGQTLAALQYLISRLVSRSMGVPVRVQLDVGDYRVRQDDRLRAMALSLAERVRANGKAYSTRPMSSYHRRIVHVTLQDEPDLQTRSYGEGTLKHVLVYRKRSEKA